MRNTNITNMMKKKAQAEILIIGGIILITILGIGSFQSYVVISDNRYVLDNSTSTVYDLTKCSINNLDNSKLIYIKEGELNEKIKEGFKVAKCD